MDEGLRVILSADVSAFEQAFAKAVNTTAQSAKQINQNLKGADAGMNSLAGSTAKLIPHFEKLKGILMAPYMREYGNHTEAFGKAMSKAYNEVKNGKVTLEELLKATKFNASEMDKLSKAVASIPLDWLQRGVDKAEKTLVKFGEGKRSFVDVQKAIDLLKNSLTGLGNSEPVEKLIASLETLKLTKKGLNDGLTINPTVHVADTLRDIEKIKGLMAGQKFYFTLSADPRPLTASLQRAAGEAQTFSLQTNNALQAISFKPVSTAPLADGLNKAEAAIKKFSSGTVTVGELNRAITGLILAKDGLRDTTAVDKLITRLQALKIEASQLQATGVVINPTVNVSDTLRDIEKVKGIIAGQQFHFQLTADGKPLQQSMVLATESTRGAVDEIGRQLTKSGEQYGTFAQKAQRAALDYVKAISQLKDVPKGVKTTVEAPDMTPVLNAVRQVKAEIAAGIKSPVAALPKLSLSADTTKFNQALLETKAVSQETWAQIKATFTGVDQAIQGAAEKARLSVAQLVQNFNALKGAGPDAVVMQVQPPDYGPVIRAAKVAKRNVDQAFLTPLPPIKMPAGADRTFQTLGKGANEAQFAMMNLSRVVQDAPYGFIGIANNLNPLLESFQRLRAQSGSTGTAMKALASSFMGAGGIGLAVGTVSSLLVVFGDKLFKAKDTTSAFKKELDKARQASEDFVSSLDLMAKARLEGAQASHKEVINLELLYNASQNHNLSLSERKKAVDALQDQYPKYFKNIKDEIILAGGATTAYNNLRTAILESAKARVNQGALDEVLKKIDVNDARGAVAVTNLAKAQETYNAAMIRAAAIEKAAPTAKNPEAQFNIAAAIRQKAKTELEKWQREVDTLLDNNFRLEAKAEQLSKKLEGSILKNGVDIITNPTGNMPTGKELKKKFEFLEEWLDFDPNKANLTGQQRSKLLEVINRYSDQFGQILEGANFRAVGTSEDQQIQAAKEWWEKFQQGFIKLAPRKIEVDFSQVPIVPKEETLSQGVVMPINLMFTPEQIRQNAVQDAINDVVNKWRKEFADVELKFPTVDTSKIIDPKDLDKVYSRMQDFASRTREILSSAATDAVSGFAEGIGNALAGGNINEAFGNVLSVLGSALQQMGKELIMTSSIVEAFKKALNGLMGPQGTAIGFAVGASMVAIGSMMKSSASKLPKFADGAMIFGPTLGIMGEYAGASSNPEVVAPLSKLKDMIRGAGGATSVNVNGSWEVSGDKLRLVLARSNRKSGRYN